MVDGRMWTYPELKFVTVHQYKMDVADLTVEVNRRFHGGVEVRTAADVSRIMKAKTIFNKEKNRSRNV
jgi:hypothetical protein